MAHIEIYYRCPICQRLWGKQKDAINCRNTHPIQEEKWAVGKGGKMVRVLDNHAINSTNGIYGALREADLSDNIHERKKQLKEEKDK